MSYQGKSHSDFSLLEFNKTPLIKPGGKWLIRNVKDIHMKSAQPQFKHWHLRKILLEFSPVETKLTVNYPGENTVYY